MSKVRSLLWLAATLWAASTSAPALAQYKWVDVKGGVHYGDVPPVGVDASTIDATGRAASAAQVSLPPALARLQSRYPVVMYATDDCKPCAMGRELLAKRGIPYTEKRVLAAADVEAFKRLGFTDVGFPSISVGRERITGFDSNAWTRLIDAAGYPAQSQLPPSYRPAAPSALAPTEARPGTLEAANAVSDDPSRILRARRLGGDPRPSVASGDQGFRF